MTTPAEKNLKANYYLKKSNEPYVKGRKYYFLTPDKYNVNEGICENMTPDGSCMFKIMGDVEGNRTAKSVEAEAYWRRGNPFGFGTASTFRDDTGGKSRRRRHRKSKKSRKSRKTRRHRRR